MSLLGLGLGVVANIGAYRIASNAVTKVMPVATSKVGQVVLKVGAYGIAAGTAALAGGFVRKETDDVITSIKGMFKDISETSKENKELRKQIKEELKKKGE